MRELGLDRVLVKIYHRHRLLPKFTVLDGSDRYHILLILKEAEFRLIRLGRFYDQLW